MEHKLPNVEGKTLILVINSEKIQREMSSVVPMIS